MGILYVILAIIFSPFIISGIGLIVTFVLSIIRIYEEKRKTIEKLKRRREERLKNVNIDRYDKRLGGPITYESLYADYDYECISELPALRNAFSKIAEMAATEVSNFDSEIRAYGIIPSEITLDFEKDSVKIIATINDGDIREKDRFRWVHLEHDLKKTMEILLKVDFWESLLVTKGFNRAESFALQLRGNLKDAFKENDYWYKPVKLSKKRSPIYEASRGRDFNPSVIFSSKVEKKPRWLDRPLDG